MIRIVPLSFWSSFPKTASRGRNRDGGAGACAARGRSAARTLAAPEVYAAHVFAACDVPLFDGAFVRGDSVGDDQSKLGCLSSRIAGRFAPVSSRIDIRAPDGRRTKAESGFTYRSPVSGRR
jgi:hypothetical protein